MIKKHANHIRQLCISKDWLVLVKFPSDGKLSKPILTYINQYNQYNQYN